MPSASRRPLERILHTEFIDGSVLSTIYLGVSVGGPYSTLESFVRGQDYPDEVWEPSGYWFETCLFTDEEDCVLRRHKTEAEAIVWHEDYLDKVLHHAAGSKQAPGDG